MNKINYSPELDILSVDDTEKEYSKSATSGDFIIDFDSEGRIRGLEIQTVSEITGADREQLEKITSAQLKTRKTGENILITLRLEIEKQKTTLAAQLQQSQLKA